MAASANGKVFTSFGRSGEMKAYSLLIKENGYETHYRRDGPGVMLPSADGRMIYYEAGILNVDLTEFDSDLSLTNGRREYGTKIPAADEPKFPQYYS